MSKIDNELKMVRIDNLGSSPVYGEKIWQAARECVKPPVADEVSLQKLDDTNIYMWHYRRYRNDVYWHGDGNAMVIEEQPIEPSMSSKKEPAIFGLAYDTGGFPIGKKQLTIIEDKLFRESNDITEQMRKALMMLHSDDWTMDTVAEAAYICSVVAKNRGASGEIGLPNVQ